MSDATRRAARTASAWLVLVALDVASPLLAKHAAGADRWLDGVGSAAFAGALACDVLAAWVWMRILAFAPLATAVPASGVAYGLVAVAGSALYGEHVPAAGWLALVLIAVGLALVAAPSPADPVRQPDGGLLS